MSTSDFRNLGTPYKDLALFISFRSPEDLQLMNGNLQVIADAIDGLDSGAPGTTFLSLSDTPGNFVGAGSYIVRINPSESALEFLDSTNLNHDSFTGFVANEHINHSSVTVTGTSGNTGGGDITSSRTISPVIATGADIQSSTAQKMLDASAVIDEDSFSTNSNQKIPTQQSVKAYIATQMVSLVGALKYRGLLSGSADLTGNSTGNAYADGGSNFLNGDLFIASSTASLTVSDGTVPVTEGDHIIILNNTTDSTILVADVENFGSSDAVTSVFGNTGAIVASPGDYTASQITNIAAGDIVAVTVQAAIDELDTEKLSKTLTNTQVFVGNGSNVATGVAMSGDVSIDNLGVTTVVTSTTTTSGKVELATDSEVTIGTDSTRAVTSSNITAKIADGAAIAASTSGRLVDASAVIDEDTFASDSNQKLPTQQSTKAFVENELLKLGAKKGQILRISSTGVITDYTSTNPESEGANGTALFLAAGDTNDGDTVVIGPGVYHTTNLIFAANDITLISHATAIVRPNGVDSIRIVRFNGNNIKAYLGSTIFDNNRANNLSARSGTNEHNGIEALGSYHYYNGGHVKKLGYLGVGFETSSFGKGLVLEGMKFSNCSLSMRIRAITAKIINTISIDPDPFDITVVADQTERLATVTSQWGGVWQTDTRAYMQLSGTDYTNNSHWVSIGSPTRHMDTDAATQDCELLEVKGGVWTSQLWGGVVYDFGNTNVCKRAIVDGLYLQSNERPENPAVTNFKFDYVESITFKNCVIDLPKGVFSIGPTGSRYTGNHTGSNNASVLTDISKNWAINSLVGQEVVNNIDGSTATITANTATTVTGTLAGGAENDWDTSDTGTHTGSNNASVLTDSAKKWTINSLVGFTITNSTDGSSATITANTQTTVTGTLTGGTDNDWDTSDSYSINIADSYSIRFPRYDIFIDNCRFSDTIDFANYSWDEISITRSEIGYRDQAISANCLEQIRAKKIIIHDSILKGGSSRCLYFEPSTGTHNGGNGESVLTDTSVSFTINALVGRSITNNADLSKGVITSNTAHTVTATLLGGTNNDWDSGDSYTISNRLTDILDIRRSTLSSKSASTTYGVTGNKSIKTVFEDVTLLNTGGGSVRLSNSSQDRLRCTSLGTDSNTFLFDSDLGTPQDATDSNVHPTPNQDPPFGHTFIGLEGQRIINKEANDDTFWQKEWLWDETRREWSINGIVHIKKITSTDATPKVVTNVVTATDTTYIITATAIAVRTSNYAEAGGYKICGVFKNDGGVLTQVGTTQSLMAAQEDTAGWDFDLDVSGTNIRVMATGGLYNINWVVQLEVTTSV